MERLIKYILEYESDTFFARGQEVTREEAVKMADKIIDTLIEGESVVLDGWNLNHVFLQEVRDPEGA